MTVLISHYGLVRLPGRAEPCRAYDRAVPTTPAPGRLVLVRHGETEWSASGQHTGLTDLPLTEVGEAVVPGARAALTEFTFAAAFVSPLLRARRTAQLLGLAVPDSDGDGHLAVDDGPAPATPTDSSTPVAQIIDDLVEWDYGGYEGLSTPQVRERIAADGGRDDWTVWADGVVAGDTPGETIEQVAARARAVIDRALPHLEHGDVILIGHGQMLRILTSVWLRLQPRFGAQIPLDAGHLCILGHEREEPAIVRWNQPPVDRR